MEKCVNVSEEKLDELAELLQNLSESLKCGICLELMINPRKIPHCGHRFCNHCLTQLLKGSSKNATTAGAAVAAAATCPLCNNKKSLNRRTIRKDDKFSQVIEAFKELKESLNLDLNGIDLINRRLRIKGRDGYPTPSKSPSLISTKVVSTRNNERGGGKWSGKGGGRRLTLETKSPKLSKSKNINPQLNLAKVNNILDDWCSSSDGSYKEDNLNPIQSPSTIHKESDQELDHPTDDDPPQKDDILNSSKFKNRKTFDITAESEDFLKAESILSANTVTQNLLKASKILHDSSSPIITVQEKTKVPRKSPVKTSGNKSERRTICRFVSLGKIFKSEQNKSQKENEKYDKKNKDDKDKQKKQQERKPSSDIDYDSDSSNFSKSLLSSDVHKASRRASNSENDFSISPPRDQTLIDLNESRVTPKRFVYDENMKLDTKSSRSKKRKRPLTKEDIINSTVKKRPEQLRRERSMERLISAIEDDDDDSSKVEPKKSNKLSKNKKSVEKKENENNNCKTNSNPFMRSILGEGKGDIYSSDEETKSQQESRVQAIQFEKDNVESFWGCENGKLVEKKRFKKSAQDILKNQEKDKMEESRIIVEETQPDNKLTQIDPNQKPTTPPPHKNDKTKINDTDDSEDDFFQCTPDRSIPRRPHRPMRNRPKFNIDEEDEDDDKNNEMLLPKKLKFTSTGLSNPIDREAFNNFVKTYDVTTSNVYDESLTHIIVGVLDENLTCNRTLKYLMGVAAGKPIIAINWIHECLLRKKLLSPDAFFVLDSNGNTAPLKSFQRQKDLKNKMKNPGLFNNIEIGFLGKFTEALTEKNITELVTLCDGSVTQENRYLERKSSNDNNKIKFLIMDKDAENTISQNEAWQIFKRTKIAIVDKDWIVESVGSYEIQPIASFLQHLFDITQLKNYGYPNALLKY